jgi:hypothetical protein
MKSSCKAFNDVALKLKHHGKHHPRKPASRWSFVPQQFHMPNLPQVLQQIGRCKGNHKGKKC